VKKGVNGGCLSVEEVPTASKKLKIDYVLGMLTDVASIKSKKTSGYGKIFYD
jgi:hypothetical protein